MLISRTSIATIKARVLSKFCDKKKSENKELQRERELARERQATFRENKGRRVCRYVNSGTSATKKKK